jgi:hypothetical protein
MATTTNSTQPDQRPDFMVELGLSPPYTPDDVKAAYLTKVKKAHPDHGGTVAEFRALQEAFEKAKQYTEFRIDRRHWIASHMEAYLAVQRVVERLKSFGAEVKTNAVDWLQKSFGDFAQLTETITTIRLGNSSRADELIAAMVAEKDALGSLTHLALPGCRLSDSAAQRLEAFKQLKHVDLSNTPITNEALWFVDELPALESLNLDGTQVGWWMKRKVKKLMQLRHDAKPVTPFDA